MSALADSDPKGVQIAMLVAATQAVNIADDPLREHLINELGRLVGKAKPSTAVSSPSDREEHDSLGPMLIEVAFQLAVAAHLPVRETVAEFARIVLGAVDAGVWIVPFARPLVEHLYLALTSDEAHELAPLVVRLRAEEN